MITGPSSGRRSPLAWCLALAVAVVASAPLAAPSDGSRRDDQAAPPASEDRAAKPRTRSTKRAAANDGRLRQEFEQFMQEREPALGRAESQNLFREFLEQHPEVARPSKAR
jgi:hypothetical protein